MKTKNKLSFKLNVLWILSLLIISCTFTTTKPIQIGFNKDVTVLEDELKSIVTCESFNVNGTETKTNDKVSRSLNITILNGVNIPANGDEQKKLAQSVGSLIKSSLKTTDKFDIYSVTFEARAGNDLVNATKSVEITFKEEEL